MIIMGVFLPDNVTILSGLFKIYGIGSHRARAICKYVNADISLRVRDISDDMADKIREFIDKNDYILETDLKSTISANIARKKRIGCHQGRRHTDGLPVRGQTTRRSRKRARSYGL